MKKIISGFLAIIFLFSVSSVFVFAEEPSTTTKTDIQDTNEVIIEDILSFSCYFDTKTQSVNIKGTMNHDAFTSHRNSIFVIYAIPPGRDEIDVLNDESIKPIAEAEASISFAFSFKTSNLIDRYSRYAIFMRSPEGEYTLTTKSQYAEISSTHKKITEKTAFKGITGNYSSFFSNSNSKKVILPVYLDSLISTEATKYVFQIENKQTFFNVAYLENLDAQIKSLRFNDANIYFQFLIKPNSIFTQRPNDNAEYILPNTFNYNNISLLHSITTFLISRYNENNDNHNISGIIIGKAWDNAPKYNSFKNIDLNDYVKLCGQYITVISNAAWNIDSNIDIAISLSADGFLENITNNYSNKPFSAKELLTKLMQYFDESTYSGISCSIFIEAYSTPLSLTADELKNGIDLSKKLSEKEFHIGEQTQLSKFFKELSTKYKSASAYYNMIWIPSKDVDSNLFCVAYAYAFYSLMMEKNVLSFIVDFSSFTENNYSFEEISHIFKNIDTSQSFDVTKNTLKHFGKETWNDVLGVSDIKLVTSKKYYQAEPLLNVPEKVKGKFYYFDFSNEVLASNWYTGTGCTDVKINYSESGKKALHGDFSLTNKNFSDLIYNYEYAENISYTPYLKMNFKILSEKGTPLYEIKFIFQNNDAIFETTSIVKGNTQNNVILDLSQAKEFSNLNNIKISLRSLDDSTDSCSLWLYDIIGYSEKNTDESLKKLIQSERNKIKKDQEEQTINQQNTTVFWVIAIVAFATVLGIILLLLLQRNGRTRRKE